MVGVIFDRFPKNKLSGNALKRNVNVFILFTSSLCIFSKNEIEENSSPVDKLMQTGTSLSKGMQEAWIIIKDDDDVKFSIDLYKFGIVIIDFKESEEKTEFALHLSY